MHTKPVLLVEDNEDDEMFAMRAFAKNGLANPVIVAHDGQEAVDYLFNPANALPAIILLDLQLPKVSGLEVLKRVRADARTGLLPVIILTSSKNDPDLRASYGLGANSYMCKSIDLDRFNLNIGEVLRYWLEYNEAPPAGGN